MPKHTNALVVEPRSVECRFQARLRCEPLQVAFYVAHKHPCQVVREAVADHRALQDLSLIHI